MVRGVIVTPEGNLNIAYCMTLTYDECMNDVIPDLFDLMSRWDVEAKAIPLYLRRHTELTDRERRDLLLRRTILQRVMEELRDVMATMIVSYRGLINGVVVVESGNEESCWARVGDRGTVEFKLSTGWVSTDSAIQHEHNSL